MNVGKITEERKFYEDIGILDFFSSSFLMGLKMIDECNIGANYYNKILLFRIYKAKCGRLYVRGATEWVMNRVGFVKAFESRKVVSSFVYKDTFSKIKAQTMVDALKPETFEG